MPTLTVLTVSGLPAFQLPCGPSDTVKKLETAAAARANLLKKTFDGGKMKLKLALGPTLDHVRLSRGKEFLDPSDTVAGLALKDGDKLKLHVKPTKLFSGVGSQAPLPAYSFQREGYAFFINMIMSRTGRALFKVKVAPSDTMASVLKQALRRARQMGIRPAGGTPKLKYRGKALEPKVRVSEIGANGLAVGDELAIAGLEGDELLPESPRSSTTSRPGTAPPTSRSAVSPRESSHLLRSFNSLVHSPSAPWLPVGATNWP